ncbi:ATP-binding cassette sub-family A member 3-like [Patiria miniata]|uniref:ABC transporter domain-containing protein n=1 Tax=Patiria miniata TaxID=46514 RepID=A0A914AL17_PATMI|nr:ATP-binding cassette sub-family A member 3-like [Patiria miniata]
MAHAFSSDLDACTSAQFALDAYLHKLNIKNLGLKSKMGRTWNQFLLLFWKNWTLQSRKVILTIFEILIPLVFAALLLIIRSYVEFEQYESPIVYGSHSVNQLPPTLLPPNVTNSTLPPYYWKIAYAPKGKAADEIMRRVVERLKTNFTVVQPVQLESAMGFNSEEDLLAVLKLTPTENILGGIIFQSGFQDNGKGIPANLTYKIRLSNSMRNVEKQSSFMTQWQTQSLFPFYQLPGPRNKDDTYGGVPGYYREGFLALQYAVDMAILQAQGATVNHATLMQRYPYPPYIDDTYVAVLQTTLPDLIMVSLVLVALGIAKNVAYEKEKRLKEAMKMMGLANWIHWSAWFIKYFIYLLITISLMTLMFCIKVGDLRAAVVTHSDPSVIFVFLMLYATVSIMYSFACSALFSKANSAAVAAGVSWFITYMPYYFIMLFYQRMTLPGKLACCLLSNTAMGLGTQLIAIFEGTGEGVQWSNINRPVSVDDDFTLLHIMLMMVGDIIIYGVFTWYVEAVFPGEYGVPQGWNFFLKPSYWCGTPVITEVLAGDSFAMKVRSGSFFEEEPTDMEAGVQIRGLTKIFPKNKAAVNGISLNMYRGQITVLLGHNGAGKTTTMSMLTGFIPPTSGTAFMNGCSIRGNLEGVRSSLGLCPQHDVLFGDLTVEEHLYFFGKLKGLTSSAVKKESDHYIEATGLQDKRKQLAKSLSGGMKRKLSVAIALIADSKVVMLDEPTSGMDPDARRSTWDLLETHKTDRTILLTTHHMDEADLLGDRIAIMSEGELQCCGTSLFLKKKYGVGYHMVMVKSPLCDVRRVSDLIHSYIPSAAMESDVGAELSFILPNEASDKFEGLFTKLEESKEELGISSYGASLTTMEEVFIKVGENSDSTLRDKLHHTSVANHNHHHETNGPLPSKEHNGVVQNGHSNGVAPSSPGLTKRSHYGSMDSLHQGSLLGESTLIDMPGDISNGSILGDKFTSTSKLSLTTRRNKGPRLYAQQFWAMLIKHILHSMRNFILATVQLAVPLLTTSVAVVLILVAPQLEASPPLVISATPYQNSIAQFSKGKNLSHPVTESLSSMYSQHFQGTATQVVDIDSLTSIPHDMRDYLISEGESSISAFNSRNLVSATFEYYDNKPVVIGNITLGNISLLVGTAFYNNQPYHTSPLSLNAIDNAYLMHYLTKDHRVTVINEPLPPTLQEQFSEQSDTFGMGSMIAFVMMFGMAFLASSFGVFLMMESSTKAKHLQIVSGVHSTTFWLSKLIWDIINYMIPCILIGILMLACRVESYALEGRVWDLYLLLFLHGWAIIPLSYLLSFLFKEPASGYVRILIINIALSMVMYFTYEVLSIPDLGLEDIAEILDWVFMLMPLYSLGAAMETYYLHFNHIKICLSFPPFSLQYCDAQGISYEPDYLTWEGEGIGRYLVYLAVEGFVYMSLVFLVDSSLFKKVAPKLRKAFCRRKALVYSEMNKVTGLAADEDVATEKSRITDTPLTKLCQTDALLISDLRKVYSLRGGQGLVAVDGISVGVPLGECFGLLGINGAGKTTTFKMLTGDESVTSGTAFLDGYSIKSDIKLVQQRMGYCPQFDALIDQMTGRETLTMYGRLRGVPEAHIPAEVNRLLKILTIEPHADKLTKTYSGGNKRKLSTAIALMGDPPIVFLDEPTTGMDPVARRLLWDTLSQIRASGKCIILTSHSMEECEALCTRLAIMVNGQFKCLGSVQHLKHRFGQGYTVLAKARHGGDLSGFKQHMEEQFPGSKLKDEHQGMVHYHITNTQLTWAQIFGTMERAKSRYDIEDYSVSQTTLEQVFLNFARMQREDVRQR